MHAIILAGGRGTRLLPITDCIPKSLISINGKPILEWQILMLAKFGIRDIIVASGYKSEQIVDYTRSRDGFGSNVTTSIEKNPLGTGGAIKKASELIKDESFIVLNGDVLTDIPISDILKVQNSLAAVQLPTAYGLLDIKKDHIIGFNEKGILENTWINGGIYHLGREMLADIPTKGNIEDTTFPKYAKAGKLYVMQFKGKRWFSIDSHKDLEKCSNVIHKMIKG
ncbi:MAG: nucleotidyl transferase [Cenarchaeum symbiont of Oopsacas minuta]|nr:nucleotidyl transferase [Cenarchaeum symbiont of Oopsacas minuta]